MANFIQFKDGISQGVKDKAKFIVEKTYPKTDPADITDDHILDVIENFLINRYNQLKKREITQTVAQDIATAEIKPHTIFPN